MAGCVGCVLRYDDDDDVCAAKLAHAKLFYATHEYAARVWKFISLDTTEREKERIHPSATREAAISFHPSDDAAAAACLAEVFCREAHARVAFKAHDIHMLYAARCCRRLVVHTRQITSIKCAPGSTTERVSESQ